MQFGSFLLVVLEGMMEEHGNSNLLGNNMGAAVAMHSSILFSEPIRLAAVDLKPAGALYN